MRESNSSAHGNTSNWVAGKPNPLANTFAAFPVGAPCPPVRKPGSTLAAPLKKIVSPSRTRL